MKRAACFLLLLAGCAPRDYAVQCPGAPLDTIVGAGEVIWTDDHTTMFRYVASNAVNAKFRKWCSVQRIK